MEIQKLIKLRPFLYHLTDQRNLPFIQEQGELLSTISILGRSNYNEAERNEIVRNRRPEHCEANIDGQIVYIRDQRPISIINLNKCLTEDYTVEDYLELLNSRVFFWPTVGRLQSHFGRYEDENPCIIKVPTKILLQLNPHVELCRLNSGATRSNPHLDGAPPERGEGTFLTPGNYSRTAGSVVEVTFPTHCILPEEYEIGFHPNGDWYNINDFNQ